MKVRITHLKAPWPLGTVVGDVLEVSKVEPWALGKCVEVGEDEEVTFTAPVVDAEAEALALAEKKAAEEVAENEAKAGKKK